MRVVDSEQLSHCSWHGDFSKPKDISWEDLKCPDCEAKLPNNQKPKITQYALNEEVETAQGEHGDDELEIDSPAAVSYGDDGYWVRAWVWVRYPEDDPRNPDYEEPEDEEED